MSKNRIDKKSYSYDSYDHYIKSQKKRWEIKSNYHSSTSYYDAVYDKYKNYFVTNKFALPSVKNIIAQGVRNGYEVDQLARLFSDSEVWGTDVGYSNKKKNIIKLDFNECPEEWEAKFDLLFSNSIDHAFDIETTLKEWKRITKQHMLIHFQWNPEGSWHDPVALVDSKEIVDLCDKLKLKILFLHDTKGKTSFHWRGWLTLLEVAQK